MIPPAIAPTLGGAELEEDEEEHDVLRSKKDRNEREENMTSDERTSMLMQMLQTNYNRHSDIQSDDDIRWMELHSRCA